MNTRRHLLLVLMLVSIGLRSIVGAPCCVAIAKANDVLANDVQAQVQGAKAHADHGGHADQSDHGNHGGHGGHGDDPSANPCCSACGPTLTPEPTVFLARTLTVEKPAPAVIRTLATQPPFPAYEATGPPLRV